MEQFRELKRGTPVYGAILIDKSLSKVLLVQLMTKQGDGAWTFPRGKLEGRDHDDPLTCAAREVSLFFG
jgi:ADP-ribose pyrophosphatase YjhB (NUDIX family)